MHRHDPAFTQVMMEYVNWRMSLQDPPLDGIGDRRLLGPAVAGLIGPKPRDPREVLDVYAEELSETILSADSPRNYAFIPAAPTEAALLFDMVVSAASLQGCSWLEAAGAVVAENQALRVLADAAGLPASAGGVFVAGGSAGNLSGLAVARDLARTRRRAEGKSEYGLRVVVSDQAHSSIASALNLLMLDALEIPTQDGRLTRADLQRALEGEQNLDDVVAIVATAGTTNAGIVDDLAAAADLAQTHGWWFHVDAAYGGAALLSQQARYRFDGIERADSMVTDPHKWWFAPYDCAALLYAKPHLAKAVHTQDASYLDVLHAQDEELNPSDLAYHLTRRARGLPLWFSLAVNGLDAYRDAVDYALDLTQYAAERIRQLPQLSLVRDPELSVVLFRRDGWGEAEYDAWSDRLLREQTAFVMRSAWRGEIVGRLVFLHPGTTRAMVDEVLASLAADPS
jgi:glutamate/tyrosine decarboxylase-like PLP-dependent enzyme